MLFIYSFSPPSFTVGGNVNWYSHYGEQYEGSLKKTENRATIWSNNLTLQRVSREKHGLKGCMHPSFHCSTIYNMQDIEAT